MAEPTETYEPLIIGRYALYEEIASGGMATVHLGRLLGAAGFSRVVAVKRLHPHFAKNPEFVAMFVDEARLAARIRHPNVVPTLDVVRTADELFLVMEYINGESLAQLMRVVRQRSIRVAPGIAASIAIGMLHGLHAAHTARGEQGEPLEIVHRDVSPQNVLVDVDGVARVLDFGIAKAAVRVQTTRDGQIKGKLGYISPEQLRSLPVGPSTDVYAASVVLWEMLAGRRLFEADDEAALFMQVLNGAPDAPSAHAKGLPRSLDEAVMRGLSLDPTERFSTAKEMATAIERTCRPASQQAVGEWVEWLAPELLRERTGRISIIESQSEIKALADVVTPIQAVPPALSSSAGVARTPGPSTADAVGAMGAAVGSRGAAGRFPPPPRAAERTVGVSPAGSPNDSDEVKTVITGAHTAGVARTGGGELTAKDSADPLRGRRRSIVVGLVVAVVALLAIIVVMALRLRDGPSAQPGPSVAAGSSPEASHAAGGAPGEAGSSNVAASPSSDASRGSPTSAGGAAPAPAPSSAATASAATPAPTIHAPTTATTTARTTRAPTVPKVDCSIPYVVDRDGIRHIRPECVQ